MLGPKGAAAQRRPLHSPNETEDQCGSAQVLATPYGLTTPGGSFVVDLRDAAIIGSTKVASVELWVPCTVAVAVSVAWTHSAWSSGYSTRKVPEPSTAVVTEPGVATATSPGSSFPLLLMSSDAS